MLCAIAMASAAVICNPSDCGGAFEGGSDAFWTDDDELRLAIAMALSKIKTKPRGVAREDIYRKMVAEQIIEHWRDCAGGR